MRNPPVSLRLERAHGRARVSVSVRADGSSYVRERFAAQPYRLFTPTPAAGEPLTVVLSNLGGGVLNGDRYDLSLTADAGSSVLLTGQAAEKIYRAADERPASVSTEILARSKSRVEWIPQGTIQFNGARLDRKSVIRAEGSARVIAGEILCLGRTAMGETLDCGLLRDHWQILIEGRPVWQDRIALTDRTMEALRDPAALDGSRCVAVLLYVDAQEGAAKSGLLESVREIMAENAFSEPRFRAGGESLESCRCGAGLVNGVLILRWLGRDPQAVRRRFGHAAGWLRKQVMGRPETLPRLWHL